MLLRLNLVLTIFSSKILLRKEECSFCHFNEANAKAFKVSGRFFFAKTEIEFLAVKPHKAIA
ncbi:MAG: hypothetical protein KGZ88_09890 [Methylomicrobium sp.]|nr:hypothetical protein [Methylomicrobium sp.]